jgi:hypothetical protein
MPSHTLLVYVAALQESRSVDCEVAGGRWVVVMLLLAKANVYTKSAIGAPGSACCTRSAMQGKVQL